MLSNGARHINYEIQNEREALTTKQRKRIRKKKWRDILADQRWLDSQPERAAP